LDKQELIDHLHSEEESLALDIHSHLEKQDAKIDKIYDMVQRIYQLLGGGNHVQDSYK
jgi:chaperonin cofactor prefoldin